MLLGVSLSHLITLLFCCSSRSRSLENNKNKKLCSPEDSLALARRQVGTTRLVVVVIRSFKYEVWLLFVFLVFVFISSCEVIVSILSFFFIAFMCACLSLKFVYNCLCCYFSGCVCVCVESNSS